MSKRSAAFDVTTIVKALTRAEEMIVEILRSEGFEQVAPMKWSWVNPGQPGHDQQFRLMQIFESVRADLPKFGELKAWADRMAEPLNAILASEGFSPRLEPGGGRPP